LLDVPKKDNLGNKLTIMVKFLGIQAGLPRMKSTFIMIPNFVKWSNEKYGE